MSAFQSLGRRGQDGTADRAIPRLRPGQLSAVVVWLAVVVAFFVGVGTVPDFFTVGSIRSILILASILGIASAAQTMVIVLGGIDLSIPSLMVLADVAVAVLTGKHWSDPAIIVVVLVATTTIGAFNGFISRALNVHPLIVTLGVGFMVTGGLLAWTGGSPQGQAPTWLTDALSAGTRMGPIHMPPVVAVWLGVALVTVFVMSKTRFGRQIYAIGANPIAAEYALVRPRLLWSASFACAGFIAGIAGLMLAGFTGYGDLGSGDPYLFDTVAAVVAGGTSLLGGRGGYLRTVAGTLLLTELQIVLLGFGLGPTSQEAAFGGVILFAVALYGRERHVRYRV